MIRLAVFGTGSARPSRVLWVVHHLVTDAVSLRLLLEDFQRAYQALVAGDAPLLPPKTASYKAHVEAAWQLGASEEVGAELGY